MARKKNMNLTYKGIVFDSVDEVEMMKWCEEAKREGFIKDFIYHPEPFLLSDSVYETFTETRVLKTKTVQTTKCKTLLKPCTYKPDFVLVEPVSKIISLLKRGPNDGNVFLVDIKGAFCVQSSKAQAFSIVRKWLYQKYGRFVNKVVTREFFQDTFVPESVRIGKSGKILTKFRTCPTIKQFKKEFENDRV